jgi:hypothetical protein
MAERTLTDRIVARLEEVEHLGPYSIALLIAAEVERETADLRRETADLGRRLEQLEGPVLYGRTITHQTTKETLG